MTMVPRAGPLSAISAPAITSWYQRGKSSSRVTIAPLAMGAQASGLGVGGPPDDLDFLGRVIGIGARRIEQGAAVGFRLGLRALVRRGEPGLDALVHQTLRLVH